MLEKDKRRNDYWAVSTIINEVKEANSTEEPTAKEVLEYMIGDADLWLGGEYVVYKYTKDTKRSFIQRLNLFWVYPAFFMVMPFQFLFTGSTGVNRNSKIGKIVDKLIKFS